MHPQKGMGDENYSLLNSLGVVVPIVLVQEFGFVRIWSSVATDLSHVYMTRINLRSEQ